jgi:hypothetical protein
MKKLLSIIFSFILTFGMIQISNAQVVEQGDITVGGGLTLTTGVGSGAGAEFGINANGFYSITDEIRAGAGLNLFFGDFAPTVFNIEGHYIFKNEDGLVLYGLAGLGFWSWSYSSAWGSASVSTSGLNLGAGVEYDLGNFFLFAEPKISTIGGTPINIDGGLRFRF